MFTSLGHLPSLPQFETRKALIIINLQNDSLFSDGELYITKNRDFVDRLKVMIPYFRKAGDIIWIRTEMGLSSYPQSPDAKRVEEEAAKADEQNRRLRKAEEEKLEDDTRDDEGEQSSERLQAGTDRKSDYTYHPTSRSKAMMTKQSATSRADQRTADMEAFNDKNDNWEEKLMKPRKGPQPKFYIAGTRGAEICDELLDVWDREKDMVVTKHHYSAFDQTSLLMSLRMKLVTELYICGCLTNVGVYATAADAVQHGLSVTVVEDCLGFRNEDKHEEAMRQMADIMGVNGIDSEEIIEESGGRPPPDTDEPIFTGPGPEGIGLQALSIENSIAEDENLAETPRMSHDFEAMTKVRRASQASKRESEHAARVDHSEGEHSSRAAVPPAADRKEKRSTLQSNMSHDEGSALPSPAPSSGKKRESWMTARTLGSKDIIGSGDSKLVLDILKPPLGDEAFALLKQEVKWQTMSHRGGNVPRLIAVQGEVSGDGGVPIYRHPADESPPLLSFTSTVGKIRDALQETLQQPFNHVLIQMYRDGTDNISEHSDKSIDIARGSSIVNVSLGAQRIMTLRKKKDKVSHESGPKVIRDVQRIPMPHNSIFVLGPQTNMQWLHGVRPDKRPSNQKTEEEKSYGGERLSLTFRYIATYMDERKNLIWGQGARKKTRDGAGSIRHSDSVEMEALAIAFGRENHDPDFDWDAGYGKGFDVINLTPAKSKLSLCKDAVANMRVELALSESKVPYTVIAHSQPEPDEETDKKSRRRTYKPGLSNIADPIFSDTTRESHDVVGDAAILIYLNRTHPLPIPADQIQHVTANFFKGINDANTLLEYWRRLRDKATPDELRSPLPIGERPVTPTTEEFHREMDRWERTAGEIESEFLRGNTLSMVDCAFWPVLNDIISLWEGFDEDRFAELLAYHERMLHRESVRALLNRKDDV